MASKRKNKIKRISDFLEKYHIIIITLSTSVLCSLGIAYYSALYGNDIFPSPLVGFILILLIELGLDTIRYLSVAVGLKKLWFINILMGIFFILSVIPATLGIGSNHKKEHFVFTNDRPEKSELWQSYVDDNNSLLTHIEKNNELIKDANNNMFNSLRIENINLRASITKNKTELKKLDDDYKIKLSDYETEKKRSNSIDPFYAFINDFFVKFMITGIQILNISMSVLGSVQLRKIKIVVEQKSTEPKIIPVIDLMNVTKNMEKLANRIDGQSKQIDEQKARMQEIEKHSQKVVEDMITLNGELEDDAIRPGFFENIAQKGGAKK